MPDFLPYLAAALLYILVAFIQWHQKKFDSVRHERLAVAIGLALHGWLLLHDLFVSGGINLSLINALSTIFWLTVLIYSLASLRYDLRALQAFVLPPAALAVLIQMLGPQGHLLPYSGNQLFEAHLVIALLAYSLFTFAALHAGLMAFAERNLHNRKSLIRLPDFPPLMSMERLLFQIIGIGFVLLTLTLISGIFLLSSCFIRRSSSTTRPCSLSHHG